MKKSINTRGLCLFVFLLGAINSTIAQVYELNAIDVNTYIKEGHIKIEPHENASIQFGVNSQYFERDGKPWFPLMGEFHYNRYPNEFWEEEIIKMKSAGISIVASYIFWNEHEKSKGSWDWKNDLDLKKFVEICKKHNMYVWLRIGPWSHGEQLHGGHPDWINSMKGKRSNDQNYLVEVDKFYGQIGFQTKGLYHNEGGPVIGVQLENEFASGQAEHIDSLKQLALKNNIKPVYFTITANTVFKDNEFGFIPLQGAYPYRGWEPGGGGATKDFLYGNDQWILSANQGGEVYYDHTLYPKGLCEQGAGSQMTFSNRFNVEPHVIEAHAQNQIGRGMNLVGYYMFHGGTQTLGLKEPGYPESYDFQAPITEFGLLRPSYKYLKVLHHFVNDFGEELTQTRVVEPLNPVRDEKNINDLRFVARVKDDSGYLFLGNTQVRIPMPDKNVRFKVQLTGETLEFPRNNFLLKGQTTAILPFNMYLNSALLKYATAQPLSRLKNQQEDILFLMNFEGVAVELAFDNTTTEKIVGAGWIIEEVNGITYLTKHNQFQEPVIITDKNGKQTIIQILTRKQAENSWRVNIQGKESLIITSADVLASKNKLELRQIEQTQFSLDVYPKPKKNLFIGNKKMSISKNGIFRNYAVEIYPKEIDLSIKMMGSNKAIVQIPKELPTGYSDIILAIDYLGGSAIAEIDNMIVTDHLFHGPTWNFGMKRYMKNSDSKEIVFSIQPWSEKIRGVSDELVQKIKEKGTQIERLVIKPQFSINIKTK